MKKILSALLGGVMLLGAVFSAGCGTTDKAATDSKIALKAGFGSSIDNSPGGQGLKKFKELVEERSKGNITIDLFGDGQIGNDKSMMEALQMGTLDITMPSTSAIAAFTKSFMVYDLPFLFTDSSKVYPVLDGESGKEILATLEPVKLVGLSYMENGFRNITNSVRPITKMEDIAGLKIRTMQNPIHLEAFKIWGANPTPMPFNEVFTALEQKIIDGQENPITLIYDAGFYEAQKYVTVSHHVYTPYVLMISKSRFDSLSPENQKILREAAVEATNYQREVSRKLDAEYLKKIQDAGVEISELPESEAKRLQEAIMPLYDSFADEIGRDRLNKILTQTK